MNMNHSPNTVHECCSSVLLFVWLELIAIGFSWLLCIARSEEKLLQANIRKEKRVLARLRCFCRDIIIYLQNLIIEVSCMGGKVPKFMCRNFEVINWMCFAWTQPRYIHIFAVPYTLIPKWSKMLVPWALQLSELLWHVCPSSGIKLHFRKILMRGTTAMQMLIHFVWSIQGSQILKMFGAISSCIETKLRHAELSGRREHTKAWSLPWSVEKPINKWRVWSVIFIHAHALWWFLIDKCEKTIWGRSWASTWGQKHICESHTGLRRKSR